jgi:hypothetical protein
MAGPPGRYGDSGHCVPLDLPFVAAGTGEARVFPLVCAAKTRAVLGNFRVGPINDVGLCHVVRHSGHLDLRAQAEGRSALRPDTPTSRKWVPLALCGGTISSLLTAGLTELWRDG